MTFRCHFLQIAEPLLIFTSERLCLSKVLFFRSNYAADIIPMNPISCNILVPLIFSALCGPLYLQTTAFSFNQHFTQRPSFLGIGLGIH